MSITQLIVDCTEVAWWAHWNADLPEVAQLEFLGFQLAEGRPGESPKPLSRVAIRIGGVRSLAFLTRIGAQVSPDWPEHLRQDQLQPEGLSYEHVSLEDSSFARRVLAIPATYDTRLGAAPSVAVWEASSAKIAL